MSWFRTLRQLDFNHFHLWNFGFLRKFDRIKLAVQCATTKVSTTNFPNQVSAIFQMIRANTAFTCIMVEIAHFCTQIKRTDSISTHTAKTHGGDIHD